MMMMIMMLMMIKMKNPQMTISFTAYDNVIFCDWGTYVNMVINVHRNHEAC